METEEVIEKTFLELSFCSAEWWADIAKSLFIALITGIVGYLFVKHHMRQIAFATEMKKYGFKSASLKKANDKQVIKMFEKAQIVKFIFVSGKVLWKNTMAK